MRRLALLVLLVAVGPAALEAQVPAGMPPVDSGLVIRAWLDSGQLRGRLLKTMRATDDSVRYCRFPGPPCDERGAQGQTAWLAAGDIRNLDVQVGTRWGKGARIGVFTGFLLSLVAASVNDYCETCQELTTPERLFRSGVVVVSSASLGALIGSAFPRFERRF